MQAEAKNIAEDVLKGINGSATPLDSSGDSTPKTPASTNPSPSPIPPGPPRASGRNLTTGLKKSKDNVPVDGVSRDKRDLGGLSERRNVDTVVGEQIHNNEEELPPNSLPVRFGGVDGPENDLFLGVDRIVDRSNDSRRENDSNRGVMSK